MVMNVTRKNAEGKGVPSEVVSESSGTGSDVELVVVGSEVETGSDDDVLESVAAEDSTTKSALIEG